MTLQMKTEPSTTIRRPGNDWVLSHARYLYLPSMPESVLASMAEGRNGPETGVTPVGGTPADLLAGPPVTAPRVLGEPLFYSKPLHEYNDGK